MTTVTLLLFLTGPLLLPPLVDETTAEKPEKPAWQPLFPGDEIPEDWVVRAWHDVGEPAPEGAKWTIEKGVLKGSRKRGTWLIWKRELGDFELEYEFKLGPRGNSGLALRSPLKGDPAFDGMELQMADLRYNPQAKDSELTGGLYRAVAPKKQVYRPEKWNRYRISLVGSKLRVKLNDVLIQDLDLSTQDQKVLRHDGKEAPPLEKRPRRGHLGFQELSRGGDVVEIRGARIRILDPEPRKPTTRT